MPKFPLERIIPSASCRISSKWFKPYTLIHFALKTKQPNEKKDSKTKSEHQDKIIS